MAFACQNVQHAPADTGDIRGDISVKNQLENLTKAVNLAVNHGLSTTTAGEGAATTPSPTITLPPPAATGTVPPATPGANVSHSPASSASPTPSVAEPDAPTPMHTHTVPPTSTMTNSTDDLITPLVINSTAQAAEAETLEVSIASIEMFDFDDQAEDEDCLNSQQLTTQL